MRIINNLWNDTESIRDYWLPNWLLRDIEGSQTSFLSGFAESARCSNPSFSVVKEKPGMPEKWAFPVFGTLANFEPI